MDQEIHNFQTLESILNRVGAQNYQQLALFDKKMFLDTSSSDILYQEKDYLYYLATKKKKIEFIKLQNPSEPIPLEFNQFSVLNEYLKPATWTLEIIGPSLSYKTTILKDLAETMTKKNVQVLFITAFQKHDSQNYKTITINTTKEFFILMSMLLESQDMQYKLIIIDGLSSLFYQTAQMNVIEHQLYEFQNILAQLKKKGLQMIISSIAKMRENYSVYDQFQDCKYLIEIEFFSQEKAFQKTILNNPWHCIWQAQLSITRIVETRYDQNLGVNKNILKFQYNCVSAGLVKPEIAVQI